MVRLSAHYLRTTTFAVTLIALIVWAATAAVLLHLFLKSASAAADPERQRNLLKFAYLLLGALILSLLLLVGVVAHYIAGRLTQPPEPFKPVGYVDAWTEAGRRLDPKDAPPVEPYEKPDSGDEDNN